MKLDPTLPLEAVRKAHVLAAYEHFGRNRTKTAQSLGIDTKTLWRYLTEAGVPPAQRWWRRGRTGSLNETDSGA